MTNGLCEASLISIGDVALVSEACSNPSDGTVEILEPARGASSALLCKYCGTRLVQLVPLYTCNLCDRPAVIVDNGLKCNEHAGILEDLGTLRPHVEFPEKPGRHFQKYYAAKKEFMAAAEAAARRVNGTVVPVDPPWHRAFPVQLQKEFDSLRELKTFASQFDIKSARSENGILRLVIDVDFLVEVKLSLRDELDAALRSGDLKSIRENLKEGCLDEAARRGHALTVHLLIEAGAQSSTALLNAVRHNHEEAAYRIALEFGVDDASLELAFESGHALDLLKSLASRDQLLRCADLAECVGDVELIHSLFGDQRALRVAVQHKRYDLVRNFKGSVDASIARDPRMLRLLLDRCPLEQLVASCDNEVSLRYLQSFFDVVTATQSKDWPLLQRLFDRGGDVEKALNSSTEVYKILEAKRTTLPDQAVRSSPDLAQRLWTLESPLKWGKLFKCEIQTKLAWIGIASCQQRLFCAPHNSQDILVIEKSRRTFCIPCPGRMQYQGIAAVADVLFCAPFCAPSVLVIDAKSHKLRSIPVSSGSMKWSGICSAGSKLYCAPFNSSFVLVVDSVEETVEYIDTNRHKEAKWSGIAAVGSTLFCAPFDASSVLVVEHDNRVSHIECPKGRGKWNGIAAVGTTLFCAPYNATQVLVIHATTRALQFIDCPTGDFKWAGITAFKDTLFCAPCDADAVLMIHAPSLKLDTTTCSLLHRQNKMQWSGIAALDDDAQARLFCAPDASNSVLEIAAPIARHLFTPDVSRDTL